MSSRTLQNTPNKLNSNSSGDYSRSPKRGTSRQTSPSSKNGTSSSDSIFLYASRLKGGPQNNTLYTEDADNTGSFSNFLPLNSYYSYRKSNSNSISNNNSPVVNRHGAGDGNSPKKSLSLNIPELSQYELPPMGILAAATAATGSQSSQGSTSSSTSRSKKTVSTSVILDETRIPESNTIRQMHSSISHSLPSGVSSSSLSSSRNNFLPEHQDNKRYSIITENNAQINQIITQTETLTRASSSTYYSLPIDSSPAGFLDATAALESIYEHQRQDPGQGQGQEYKQQQQQQQQQQHIKGRTQTYTYRRNGSLQYIRPGDALKLTNEVFDTRRRFTEYTLPVSATATTPIATTTATTTTTTTTTRLPKRFSSPHTLLSPRETYNIPRRFESLRLRDSYGTVSLNKVPYTSDLIGRIPSHLDSSSSSDIFLSAIDLSRHVVKSDSSNQPYFEISENMIPTNTELATNDGTHAVTMGPHNDGDIENMPLLVSSPLSTLSTMDADITRHFRGGHNNISRDDNATPIINQTSTFQTQTQTQTQSQNQSQPHRNFSSMRNLQGAHGVGSIMGSILVTPQPGAIYFHRPTAHPLQFQAFDRKNYYYYDNDNYEDYSSSSSSNNNNNQDDKLSIEHDQQLSSESIKSFDSKAYKFYEVFSVFNVIKLLLLGFIVPPFFFMVVFNESCGIPEYKLVRMLMNEKHRASLLFKGEEFWDVDTRWFKKLCLFCGLLEFLVVIAAIGVGFGVRNTRSG